MHVQVDSLFKLTSSPLLSLLPPSRSLPTKSQLCSWSLTATGSLSDHSKAQQLYIKLETWVYTAVSGRGIAQEHPSFPNSLLLGWKTSLGGLKTNAAACSREMMTGFGSSCRCAVRGCRGSLGKWRCIPEWTPLFSVPLQCTSLTSQFLISLSKI